MAVTCFNMFTVVFIKSATRPHPEPIDSSLHSHNMILHSHNMILHSHNMILHFHNMISHYHNMILHSHNMILQIQSVIISSTNWICNLSFSLRFQNLDFEWISDFPNAFRIKVIAEFSWLNRRNII
jgi:hypothetical protein